MKSKIIMIAVLIMGVPVFASEGKTCDTREQGLIRQAKDLFNQTGFAGHVAIGAGAGFLLGAFAENVPYKTILTVAGGALGVVSYSKQDELALMAARFQVARKLVHQFEQAEKKARKLGASTQDLTKIYATAVDPVGMIMKFTNKE